MKFIKEHPRDTVLEFHVYGIDLVKEYVYMENMGDFMEVRG